MSKQEQHYSLLIERSDRDQSSIVCFPEWEQVGHFVHTHGATYHDAVEKGQEMLDFLMQSALDEGETIPDPRAYAGV